MIHATLKDLGKLLLYLLVSIVLGALLAPVLFHGAQWLAGHSREMVAARKPGARLGVIENAPGSYVRVKS